MGLDNIPNAYPCIKRGTAIRVQQTDAEGKVILDDDGNPRLATDCGATQSAGGCPWQNRVTTDLGGDTKGRVSGLFGTDCWYRGKWGNHILQALGIYDEPDMSFYGDNTDGSYKSPESCLKLADALEMKWKANEGRITIDDDEQVGDDVQYAAWWLRWVAEEADGSACWY